MQALDKATCKAARSFVDWTASELGQAAGVPVDTIRSFESGRTRNLSRDNEAAIRSALEARGIHFIETGQIAAGPGLTFTAIA
jgi:DNA-binding XRE family transcriptional regulator